MKWTADKLLAWVTVIGAVLTVIVIFRSGALTK